MKIVIRHGIFETNSSSSHSITIAANWPKDEMAYAPSSISPRIPLEGKNAIEAFASLRR